MFVYFKKTFNDIYMMLEWQKQETQGAWHSALHSTGEMEKLGKKVPIQKYLFWNIFPYDMLITSKFLP